MNKNKQETANLLGATVLGLNDELRQAVESYTGRTGESSSAIVILGHQPGISNDQLTKLLELSHTGTVRLIDRLVTDGLVKKQKGDIDKRSTALFLTDLGKTARKEILKARETKLGKVLNGLTEEESKVLKSLLGKLLQEVAQNDNHKLRICRLCDSESCPNCPIHVAV